MSDESTLPVKSDPLAAARAARTASRLADIKELVLACRDKLDDRFDQVFDEVFNNGTRREKMDAIRILMNRAYGKVPDRVIIEGEDGSFDSIMTEIARSKVADLAKAGAIDTELVEEVRESNGEVRKD